MTDELAAPVYEFDAALSFAGEDRQYVEEVAAGLKTAGVHPFLDSDYLSEMWGEDLVEFFDGVYRLRSRFAIIFVSRHYAEKMWPRQERRSALARAVTERGAYVLPVRLDDTELDGLRPTVGYLDARVFGIEKLVKAFVQKLSAGTATPEEVEGTPRTPEQIQWVLDNRPPWWEYRYFAGLLLHEFELLAAKQRDFELGYAPPGGEWVPEDMVPSHVARALATGSSFGQLLERVMDPAAQERAFGAPGEPGDPAEIRHLAARWTAIYERFLDWATDLRATVVPHEYRRLLDLLAHFMDSPIREYREFVENFTAQVDRMPELLADATEENPMRIEMTVELQIDDAAEAEYQAEWDRLFGG